MEILFHNNLQLNSKHGESRPFLYDIRYPEGESKLPVLVFVHGFKGFKDWGVFNIMAERLARAGYLVAKLNLSHNGTTPEKPSDFADLEAFGNNNFSIELDDLDVLLTELVKPSQVWSSRIEQEKIGLIGHSRGGSLALLKAGHDNRIKAVVSLAAVADLTTRYPEPVLEQWEKQGVIHVENSRTGQQMPLYYQLVEDFKAQPQKFSIHQALSKYKVPALFVHGTADSSVPVTDLHKLKQWYPKADTLLIDGADHTFGGKHPWPHDSLPADFAQVNDKMVSFFNEALKN